jgi:hypothetical protein
LTSSSCVRGGATRASSVGGIRQHTSAYVRHTSAYVSIRQHTLAYVRHASAYVSIRQHTAYVSIRQHTSAYVSIRQHTCRRHGREAGLRAVAGWPNFHQPP